MALPMLVNNADCGPSNALQGLSKRFDQDRGLQQDHFGNARAGSSRETFRSQTAAPNGAGAAAHLEDAARFFAAGQPGPQFSSANAFDLSALHGSLPPAQMQMQGAPPTSSMFQPQGRGQAPAAWAADFMQHLPGPELQKQNSSSNVHSASAVVSAHTQQQQQWSPGPAPMFSPFAGAGPQMYMQNYGVPPNANAMMHQQPQQQASMQHDQILWDRGFETVVAAPSQFAAGTQLQHETQQAQAAQPQIQPAQVAAEADELARTAGLLLETVRDAQATNTKFQNSAFLGLMRGLRDREVVVEGNEVVKNTGQQQATSAQGWASDFSAQALGQGADVKGKGRAVDVDLKPNFASVWPGLGSDMAQRNLKNVSFAEMTSDRLAEMKQQEEEGELDEDPNDAYFRQENAEYQRYWASQNQVNAQASTSMASQLSGNAAQQQQSAEWDHLQADWDAFEATSAGIQPVSQYMFQRNNPYVSDTPNLTMRHHLAHGGRQPMLDSVLELEAVVQRNMTDASAWFDLGVKQQANEREKQALQALTRAVELDPSYLAAWLALAISHTNDGNRAGTHDAVRQWVERNERYAGAVARYRAAHPEKADAPMAERFGSLIQCLIEMARNEPSGGVDADIQIALAVLLNTNEDYEKAQDCFRTALAVRPDDWLLYNRVGATMANSGRAEEALQYYNRALELNPMYIRARFNLGISCINLRRFEEAAHHILDALGLQESDGVSYGGDGNTSGVTTTALWDSLRTSSMHMQRPDLATFCDRQDLEAF
ncbi:hypothetical protein MVEN_00511300 [Mycena venus]|uniref:Peroxisomal targeting signal receptor n=1 Tax=Mycena venus TaxID=2733690 RepID=A0A8H7D7H5_9AGAR|nr:hypothetical protein MVEN_00511300 [Mycena venus]